MSKTIKEVLQLHWMDGAKLSGGSYHGEPSINAEEAMAEIARLLEGAKPMVASKEAIQTYLQNGMTQKAAEYHGRNHAIEQFEQNLLKALEEV